MTMDKDRWARLQSLFEAASELETPEARAVYLDEHCGDDTALRREVESLLAASASASSILGRAVREAARDAARDLTPGQRIGPWALSREIGRGGMGAVFLANRADGEYEAQAAVKVIGGVVTAEHLRRFRAERQILAGLDHPNIARLLDGGTTAAEVPWVAMEYVDGTTLDAFCDRKQLSLEDRLRLFLQVCAAVEYAHRHLVVHRDLKPGNILVTEDGTPKLLDFGIAKLLATDSPDALQTGTAVRLLTPAFASPEQLRGASITVATDVYSLGVLLYQLLTRRLPHDVAGKSLADVERIVCNETPPKPSSVAGEPGARRLRGDLDTIVMTAMHKDPARRYASVERLADDIRNHLESRPVLARPDSGAYRVGRFLRRHRGPVAAASLIVVLLVAFAITMSVQARRLAVERDAATVARANAEQVASFLKSVFEVADPSESRGRTVTARELLDAGAARIDSELAEQPVVQASMMRLIANTYGTIGLQDAEGPLLEKALKLHLATFGERHEETATSQMALAVYYQDIGDFKAAEPLFRQSLATRRALYGDDDPAVTEGVEQLAYLLQVNGNLAGAEEQFREALALNLKQYPVGDRHVLMAKTRLSRALRETGKLEEAEQLLREALAGQRALYGRLHPDIGSTLRNLGTVLRDRDKLDEADTVLQEAISVRRAVLGDSHPEFANTLNSYGTVLQRKGDIQRATEVFREFVSATEKYYKKPHPTLAAAYSNLAGSLRDEGRYDQAEEFFTRAREVNRVVLRADHPNQALPIVGLADVHMRQKRYARAEALYREALGIRRKAFEAGHRYIGETLSDLGASLTAQRRYREAASLLSEAYALLQKAEGDEASRTKRARARIAELERLAPGVTQAGQPR